MNLLSRIRLSSRLTAGFGLVLPLLLCITGISLERMASMDERTREIVEVGNRRLTVAQSMMNAANDGSVAPGWKAGHAWSARQVNRSVRLV